MGWESLVNVTLLPVDEILPKDFNEALRQARSAGVIRMEEPVANPITRSEDIFTTVSQTYVNAGEYRLPHASTIRISATSSFRGRDVGAIGFAFGKQPFTYLSNAECRLLSAIFAKLATCDGLTPEEFRVEPDRENYPD